MGNVIPAMFLGHYLLNFTFWPSTFLFQIAMLFVWLTMMCEWHNGGLIYCIYWGFLPLNVEWNSLLVKMHFFPLFHDLFVATLNASFPLGFLVLKILICTAKALPQLPSILFSPFLFHFRSPLCEFFQLCVYRLLSILKRCLWNFSLMLILIFSCTLNIINAESAYF